MRQQAVMVVGLCLALGPSTLAATNSWKGGSGDWDTQQKWSLNKRPANDQDIAITNTGTFTVTVDDNTRTNTMAVLSITASNTAGASRLLLTNRPSSNSSLLLSAAELHVGPGSMLEIASGHTGRVATVWAGNARFDSPILLKSNANLVASRLVASQSISISNVGGLVFANTMMLEGSTLTTLGGQTLIDDRLQIGSLASTGFVARIGGKLAVAGTTVSLATNAPVIGVACSEYDVSIAACPGKTGTVVLANGTVTANTAIAVGERGLGRLVLSNGTFEASIVELGAKSGGFGSVQIADGNHTVSFPRIGLASGATGEVFVQGGKLTTTSVEIGGAASSGSLTISNGTVRSAGIACAAAINGLGTITVAGGKLDIAEQPGGFFGLMDLGNRGTGTLWQTGGELYVTNSANQLGGRIRLAGVVFGGSYAGRLICSGGLLRASEVHVGHPAPATTSGSSLWAIAGGTSVVERVVYLSSDGNTTGDLIVSGGRLEVPSLHVGFYAETLLGGESMHKPADGGTLTIADGSVAVAARLDVGGGNNPPSMIHVSGGTLTYAGTIFSAFIGAGGAGIVNVSSGSFKANVISLGAVSGSSGTLNVSGGMVGDTFDSSFGTILRVGDVAGTTGTVRYVGGELRMRSVAVGQSGIGILHLQGGTLVNPRRALELGVGVLPGSAGTVWVSDGVFLAGTFSDCLGCRIGLASSGRLSATGSVVRLFNPRIGAQGTLECVNGEFTSLLSTCATVNSNVMRFVNSTGTFEMPLQNSATILVNSSTVTFLGAVNNTGLIVATNGTLHFVGSLNNAGAVLLGPEQFRVTTITTAGNDITVHWQALGGNRYRVQAAAGVSEPYQDISPEITAVGSGLVLTNFLDTGALTNLQPRIYRVRQVW